MMDSDSKSTDTLTTHRDIDVGVPVHGSDWLQCDVPLCPVRVASQEPNGSSQQYDCEVVISPEQAQTTSESSCPRNVRYPEQRHRYQVAAAGHLQTVHCQLHGLSDQPQELFSDADHCQMVLLEQLQTAFLCYHGHVGSYHGGFIGAGSSGDGVSLHTSADGASARLLAFSQQLSENILNEALQISSIQHGDGIQAQYSAQHQAGNQSAPAAAQVNARSTANITTSQITHSTAPPMNPDDFVHIPVEIEFSEPDAVCSMELDSVAEAPGLGQAFKKIVLIEEEPSNDSNAIKFIPHSVQRECIFEEAPKDLSSSDNSPCTPQEAPKDLSSSDNSPCTPQEAPKDLSSSNNSPCTPRENAIDKVESFAANFVGSIMGNQPSTSSGMIHESTSLHSGQSSCVGGNRDNVHFGVATGVGLPFDEMQTVLVETLDGETNCDALESEEANDSFELVLPGITLAYHYDNGAVGVEPRCHDHVIGAHGTDGQMGDVPANREAIECLVDRILKLAFQSGFDEIEERINTGTDAASVCAPGTLAAITEYVDGMLDDTFESAMYRIREYVTEISRRRHSMDDRNITMYMSDKTLDQEWNAQLSAFVDDFVMNVMEEALFINKTQSSDFRMRTGLRSTKHKSLDYSLRSPASTQTEALPQTSCNSASTSDSNTKYFEMEFNVDIHNSPESQRRGSNTSLSRHYLRAEHSSGSSRRGSYEDDSMRIGRRRSSAGFRDAVLSEFEDELVHSDISTPSLKMFEDGDLQATERRASEPLGRTSRLVHDKGKKRARSVDSGTSRRVILQWLDGQSSSTSSSQSTTSRKRTSSSHLDWFAQDLLVEAFNDAFVALFGRNYEGLQVAKQTEPTIPELTTPTTESLVNFAESLTQQILQDSLEDISAAGHLVAPNCIDHLAGTDEYYSMSDSQDEYMDAMDLPMAQLERIAENFSAQIMEEALIIVHTDLVALEEQNIVTLIRRDSQFGALIHWAAVTRAGANSMAFIPQCSSLYQLPAVVSRLRRNRYSVADLLHLVLTYIEDRAEENSTESLFTYILDRLHTT